MPINYQDAKDLQAEISKKLESVFSNILDMGEFEVSGSNIFQKYVGVFLELFQVV